MAKQSLIGEFVGFIRHERKWWMIPLMAILLAVGAVILFSSTSALAPFLYPFF